MELKKHWKTTSELIDHENDSLRGNINRMILSDDIEELRKMKDYAIQRLTQIEAYKILEIIREKDYSKER